MKITITDNENNILESIEGNLFIYGAATKLTTDDRSDKYATRMRRVWDDNIIKEHIGDQISFSLYLEGLLNLLDAISDENPQKQIIENALDMLNQFVNFHSTNLKGTLN